MVESFEKLFTFHWLLGVTPLETANETSLELEGCPGEKVRIIHSLAVCGGEKSFISQSMFSWPCKRDFPA